ncbi:sigma-70 family RNA polymerase sigma factor [Phytohabitans sp. LJ34]|uniref:sigma-70 family RNA polymerase sigma factor n=1 Tax=Phytohabitans sp. LJ34 TaxID=3452217 RepID=UPI003F89A85E
MPASRVDETSLVVAAQAGDRRALDELVTAYLPLVYTIVRRALGGLADVDDVVQETMLRALRELRTLRTPESFRPWLATIATRQISTHLHRRQADARRTAPLDEVIDLPDADAESLALTHVELSSHRRQAVRASRWLDPDDRALLSLWWLETAGQLTRAELAAASGTSAAHAGVRVQRMRQQLELSRSLVAALEAHPRCAQLTAVVEDWNGVPGPLWRKRITRHTRSCPVCTRAAGELVPLERLVAGLALLSVPVALSAAVLLKSAVTAGVKAGFLGQLAQAAGAHPVATAVMAGTLVAGAAVTTATWSAPAPPGRQAFGAPTSASAPRPVGSAPAVAPAPSTSERVAPSSTRANPTVASPSGTPPFTSGRATLESVNAVGLFVTTGNDLGVLERADAAASRQRATFEVVHGLADPGCVSLRVPDGRYLRHSSWRLRLSADDGTELFRGDATFCVRAGSVPGSVSLESSNYPGAFLRHRGTELWVDPSDGSAAFRADASFRPRPPSAG